jgi:hypothetical protein
MFIDTPSGERIQQLSQVYLGFHEDFVYNPLIAKQQEKCLDINNIPEKWNNPPLIFCYSHRIQDLTKKLETIQNTCIFLFTNSDQNMTYDICKPLLEFDRIKHIFCQNIQFMHEKASFIPIGLANTQWSHGNPEFIKMVNRPINKTSYIFSSFNVSTNTNIREGCLNKIENLNIENKHFSDQESYVNSLASHNFSICPEGNGTDTHRFWESLFVETVPIVTRSPLTEQIYASGIPCVLIDSWETFDINSLPDYSLFKFDETYYNNISFAQVRTDILNKVASLYSSMNVVLSFIGNMPKYTIECIQQLRLFFDGPIYLIYSLIDPSIKTVLDTFRIIYIDYKEVESERFNITSTNKSFCVVDRLNDRKELFKRSYERLYLLDNLLLKYNLTNVWFMEIDILMYCNPNIFTATLQLVPYVYCYHKENHCSSAILYVRDYLSLQPILDSLDQYSNGFMSEMIALNFHYSKNANDILFPLITPYTENIKYWEFYSAFHTFIFDGATIGQYLFGVDPVNNNNTITRNDSSKLDGHVKIWNHGTFEWYKNNKGLNIPYFKTDNTLVPIANLHIHSKDLISAISYDYNN